MPYTVHYVIYAVHYVLYVILYMLEAAENFRFTNGFILYVIDYLALLTICHAIYYRLHAVYAIRYMINTTDYNIHTTHYIPFPTCSIYCELFC